MTDRPGHPDCEGCAIRGMARREFVRDAVAGALALLPVAGLPVSLVRGVGTREEKAYPFPAADGVAIDRTESVIIARFDGKIFAFSLACPHQNTAIRWDDGRRRFQCPKHKSRYRTDGTFIEGRATRGLDRFAIRRSESSLLVNLDALYREDEDAARWATAFIQLEK